MTFKTERPDFLLKYMRRCVQKTGSLAMLTCLWLCDNLLKKKENIELALNNGLQNIASIIYVSFISVYGNKMRWVKNELPEISWTTTVSISEQHHYTDVTMSVVFQLPASQLFTQPLFKRRLKKKHQSSVSLAFVRGIHRWIHHTKGQ